MRLEGAWDSAEESSRTKTLQMRRGREALSVLALQNVCSVVLYRTRSMEEHAIEGEQCC